MVYPCIISSGVASGRAGGADCPTTRVSVPKRLGRSTFLVVTFVSVISKYFLLCLMS